MESSAKTGTRSAVFSRYWVIALLSLQGVPELKNMSKIFRKWALSI